MIYKFALYVKGKPIAVKAWSYEVECFDNASDHFMLFVYPTILVDWKVGSFLRITQVFPEGQRHLIRIDYPKK